MDIVDAQLHFGPVGKPYGHGPVEAGSGIIDSTLEAMDSLGITSAIVDEYWYWTKPTAPKRIPPGEVLANGAWRAAFPLARLASILHPDRFAAMVRIDRNDPELESVMRVLATTHGVRAFRALVVWTREDAAAFVGGAWDRVFAIAEDMDLPMCLAVQGFVEYLPRYAARFPRLQFIVDHWGMGIPLNSAQRPEAEHQRTLDIAYLDELMKLAEHANVAVKIGHALMHFRAGDYPFAEVRPHLRRAIAAFGAERLIWESDKTLAHPRRSWAELLFSLREDETLSSEEKTLILGGNARRIFKWPKPIA